MAELVRSSALQFVTDLSFERTGRLRMHLVGVACTAIMVIVPVRTAAIATTPPPSVRMAETPAPSEPSTRELAGESSVIAPASTYTVVAGDCLWRIARRHLEGAGGRVDGERITALWKAIYERNRSVIGNDPNLILPGQVLAIPTV